MREIKFRAWNKAEERLYEVTALVWSAASACKFSKIELLSLDATSFCFATGDACSNYELMQYTGLKDKNGKEIYEGDIIRAEEEGLGVIKYGIGCFYYDDDWNGRIALEELTDILTVVGNVYEHRHLIEGDQA